uniref:hypothetical protein n=1 Tax=Promicromonospora sp. CA-291202 TaxID=3240016 RepID=UPI003F4909CF
MTNMTDEDVAAVTDQMIAILRDDPDPDPMLFGVLEPLPLTGLNLTKIMVTLAIADAGMSFRTLGIDLDDPAERADVTVVNLGFHLPADDVPDFEKAAGELLVLAAEFLLMDVEQGEAQGNALAKRTAEIVETGPEFAFWTLTSTLSHMRALLWGDTSGVVRL